MNHSIWYLHQFFDGSSFLKIIIFLKLIFLRNKRFDFFHQRCKRKHFCPWGLLGFKNLSTLFLNWNLDTKNFQEMFSLRTFLEFQTHISPKQVIWFSLSRSQSELFYFYWNLQIKNIDFFQCIRILMDREIQNVLMFLTCFDIQTQFSSVLHASFFNEGVNRWLLTWGKIFVPNYLEICSWHLKWSPDWPEVAIVLLVSRCLGIPNRLRRKLQNWIFLAISELMVYFFQMTVRWNIVCFCPLDWHVGTPNMR